ncbi:MarR family winged helix-turn-helix transcriptional regulator [Amycolatopsis sp. NPDC098790]|uniref:MarR family winged helix-turn-helix transcriptional regulator n=1 Tax=Amycolatopsis sp. NPDC098790 TaxID=3363939 RepID=UPI003815A102
MSPAVPLSFDPIERAAELWGGRIGDPTAMAAVTNVMRVQQILQREVDAALARHGITFARYEALVLLSFARTGRLAMSVMGRRLQLHPTSVTNIVDRLEGDKLVRLGDRPPRPERELLTPRRRQLLPRRRTGHAHRALRAHPARGRPRLAPLTTAATAGGSRNGQRLSMVEPRLA